MIKLFGGRLLVSVYAVALFIIISFSVDAEFFYIALLCALCHELAHALAIKLCGTEIERITIYPFGADIRADLSILSPAKEAIIAAAGPAANLILAIPAYFIYVTNSEIYALALLLSNLTLFAVNIFPIKGLDGGRLLFALLTQFCDFVLATKLSDSISTVAFAFLGVLSLLLVYLSGYNLSLVLIWTYLFISGYVREKLVV